MLGRQGARRAGWAGRAAGPLAPVLGAVLVGVSVAVAAGAGGFALRVAAAALAVAAGTACLGRYESQRRAVERLSQLALHDPLTGLPNRALLLDRARAALARMARSGLTVAIMMMDIDHFKDVNDRFGHLAGDEALAEVARRLSGCLRSADTVARFGGDELVVLCEGLAGEADALALAARLEAALAHPLALRAGEVVLSASIGIALAAPACGDGCLDDLLEAADSAMYQAKDAGRARHVLYDPGASVRPRRPVRAG